MSCVNNMEVTSMSDSLCLKIYDKSKRALKFEELTNYNSNKGKALMKISESAPYNILENTLIYEKAGQRNSIRFSELLDESLGELESSIIFSKEIDLQWLLFNYNLTNNGDKPLSLVYCHKTDCLSSTDTQILQEKSNIEVVRYYFPFEHRQNKHNAKLMILKYTDQSIRIVVPSSSFAKESWDTRSMIVWVSERLPIISSEDSGNGDSVTKFKKDLIRYLRSYSSEDLIPWIETVKRVNFKNVNVFFVGSIPGDHDADYIERNPTGHLAVKRFLSKYSAPVYGNSPIVAQAKVLSKSAKNDPSGFLNEIAVSLIQDSSPSRIRKVPDYNIIMTSFSNYEDSYNKDVNVFYKKSVHKQQDWVHNDLYHWKGHTAERTRALHSMKSYARWSDRGLYWFMFGSQNLTRSGFGSKNWFNLPSKFRISNFEAGVLFMPRIIIAKNHFPMTEDQREEDHPIFPLPYRVPLEPYGPADRPYFSDDKK